MSKNKKLDIGGGILVIAGVAAMGFGFVGAGIISLIVGTLVILRPINMESEY